MTRNDDDSTVPRCIDCNRIALTGGPIVPSWEFCSRLMECLAGPAYRWCATSGIYQVNVRQARHDTQESFVTALDKASDE